MAKYIVAYKLIDYDAEIKSEVCNSKAEATRFISSLRKDGYEVLHSTSKAEFDALSSYDLGKLAYKCYQSTKDNPNEERSIAYYQWEDGFTDERAIDNGDE